MKIGETISPGLSLSVFSFGSVARFLSLLLSPSLSSFFLTLPSFFFRFDIVPLMLMLLTKPLFLQSKSGKLVLSPSLKG